MKILALDIGKTRTGIAIGDTFTKTASPVKVMSSQEVFSGSKEFQYLLSDYEVEFFVIGLPVSLDGSENAQAKWVRSKAEKIFENTKIPYEFQDERLSSVQAKKILQEQGMTEKEMRGRVDMIAASLFLQTYIDTLEREKIDE